MRSNYKKIGDFIQLVDVRNRDLKVERLVGLSISKEFIPSVANITGTDMSKYKIIRKGQFACSIMQVRRDKKMPIALMTEFDEAIISQAYPIFEIKDENELHPEYLMMWFSRSEFDRHACFLAVGGVRGSLEWDDFLEMELPVPSIEKQREIVKEYNTVVNRIKLNEQLNQKLEETAQAIYKQWFVEFEFPNEEGKPYKSSGGKMVWNEELDKEIPEGWEVDIVGNFFETLGGGTPSTTMEEYWENGDVLWYSPTDVTGSQGIFSAQTSKKITSLGLNKSSAKIIPPNSLLMTSRATVGKLIINEKECSTNQGFISLIPNDKYNAYYLFDWTKTQLEEIMSLATGSTFLEISKGDFRSLIFIDANNQIVDDYQKKIAPIFGMIKIKVNEILSLIDVKDLLLSKMTKVKETTVKEMI